ncbi:hypothetical protein ACVKXF_001453 [Curtobacterium sp. PvP017]|jgi:hypothetical protein|uniref:Membrane protein n=1 Tax=Curtobacterium oceanosedimentum TaxID=465820 RepID=A0A147DR59_9MICO|nr:membrane protein [Curtobacterium sp. MR_MD2014]EYT65945.1 membrane protein [Curtobacterium flaccumfaciens UCD-AKU]KTR20403.1 membrane protein [Curtobacterium citreum]KTR39276.1 membrane protein [Curtobacterium oceanosedimentum]MBP1302612.1 hypothetical protein [Curtobacterium sp. 1310]MDP9737684.1 hypothetical protein [Curtobacterium sp. 260]MDQ0538086.1 hypothetical protein [Curtobacterium flaccumfaciens]RDI01329.1 hypothetical protein DEU32_102359 [Curtobacterium sp. AG1037]ROQ05038.1 
MDSLLALELFYVGLLGLASLAIAFISVVVVVKLFKGQR